MQVQPRMIHQTKSLEIKSWLILSMCMFYLLQFFANVYFFKIVLAILCLIVFALSLSAARLAPRIFGFIMVVTGMILDVFKGSGVEGIVNGILANLPLLTLVILVPLLSIPFKVGGYFHAIHYYLERLCQNTQKMFGSISVFLFFLGPILNLGSIRVLHEMIQDLKIRPVILAKSYLVGFSTVILWSPYFASVAMVLYYLQIPIFEYLPLGLSSAIIQLIVGNVLFAIWNRKHHLSLQEETVSPHPSYALANEEGNEQHRLKMKKLVVIVLGLFVSIFLVEMATKWPMLVLVSLTSIFFPLLWCSLQRQWTQLGEYFERFKEQSVPTMSNEIVMFIGAGLFGKALVGTSVADAIKLFLNQVSHFSFLLFVFTVLATILIFTFIGVHQIVVVTVLITQMDPAVIGTTPKVLALLLMTGWSMSAVLSPVNPLNLLVSSSVKKPSLQVGLKWNGVYLLAMFIVGSLYVYFLH